MTKTATTSSKGQSKIAGPLRGIQWRDIDQPLRPLDSRILALLGDDGTNFVMIRYLLTGGCSARLREVSDFAIENALDRLASMKLIHCPDGCWRKL